MKKPPEELVYMIQQLIDAGLPEKEENELIEELSSSVLYPRIVDLIYYNMPQLTAKEVVDRALAYRPIEL